MPGVRRRRRPTRPSAARPTSGEQRRGRSCRPGDRTPARASGGSASSSWAEITKCEAQPTIAPSAQSTPTGDSSAPDSEVQHQDEPGRGERRADEGEPAGALAVAQPQPHDDRSGSGVLDQDRRSHLHVLDGGEVAELCAGDRQDAVDQDQPCVAPEQRPATAQRHDADRDEHRSARAPIRARASRRPGSSRCPGGPRARAPDSPKETADTTASSQARRPSREPRLAWSAAGVSASWVITLMGHDTRPRRSNVSTWFSLMTPSWRWALPWRWPTARSEPDTLESVADLEQVWERFGYSGRHERTRAELDAVRAIRPRLREVLTADRERAVALVNEMLAEAQAVPQLVRHGASSTGTSTRSTSRPRCTCGSSSRPRWRWST